MKKKNHDKMTYKYSVFIITILSSDHPRYVLWDYGQNDGLLLCVFIARRRPRKAEQKKISF